MDTINLVKRIACFVVVAIVSLHSALHAETTYNPGNYVVKDIWVDPSNGADSYDGSTRAKAVRDINTAWGLIQQLQITTTGYRIMLVAGMYSADSTPNFQSLAATFKYPVIIQAADGNGTASLPRITVIGCSYLYFIGVNIRTVFGGDAFGATTSDHLLLSNCGIDGLNSDTTGSESQNAVSFTTCQYCYIEDCTIKHSTNALAYFSACQYGHILHSTLDSTAGTGIYAGSGSAYLYFERNMLRNAAGRGFLLGGTSYLDYDFITPWLHYDTYDIKIDNNIIANTQKEAFLVNGSYDALIAYNTFYKTGDSAATMFIVGLGNRTCNYDQLKCKTFLDSGAWGTVHIYQTDDDAAWIPNKHLYIYNNIFYNPTGSQTSYGELSVWGSRKALSHASCPKPAYADDDMEFKGNVIFNGVLSKPLGLSDTSGCQDSNLTCNKNLIITENSLNIQEPDLVGASNGDLHPKPGSFLFSTKLFAIPNFIWTDLPGRPIEPQGDLSNAITIDFDGKIRSSGSDAPGSFKSSTASVHQTSPADFSVGDPVPNPASDHADISFLLTGRALVRASVHDLLGREIELIANESFEQGMYHLPISIANLATGAYYICVSAEGTTITKAFSVIR
ncbi:MAG TPA: right-handed parallel beta-helix repeat-containing protein [Candidatus Kapabacteria bacterium]|nr:right-handed parallel beta-helix repeat-containing protein [Candidatus Kapabacteria bacterium]